MENKKWYKRTSTLFWFVLATLPLIVALIGHICGTLVNWSDTTTENTILLHLGTTEFTNGFYNVTNWFGNYTPPILKNSFKELFINFGLIQDKATLLGMFFGWFTWTYFIHLMVDIIVWLPKIFHKWLERWD